MKFRWLLSPLALAALALDAGAQVRAEAGMVQAAEIQLPPVSAAPPSAPAPPGLAPAAALELLPPGTRSPTEGGAFASADEGSSAYGAVVERLGDPPDSDRLEVKFTVDPELDERVRGVLKRLRAPLGHVIMMDPASGEIFSYVSTDPETFPATRTYPTASLMKVVTAAAVLRHAPAAAERDCRYLGSPHKLRTANLEPPVSGGRVDSFWRAIAISNNQCFARLAVHDVGEEALIDEMRGAGMLEAPAPRHGMGRVEAIESDLDLGRLGSGLAGSFITPLAAARLASLLAEGKLVSPYWIAAVRDAEGRTLVMPGRRPPRQVWPPEVAEKLRELMVGVTARGTAKSAFRDERGRPLLGDVRVAGKTGSLSGSDPKGRYEWFIGVAPAEAPRVAIATVVVNGPLWWSNASDVAAWALREVFCDRAGCNAAQVERLHARAHVRDAAAGKDLAAMEHSSPR
jgi:cell division protein FtsI/penicillin-binding protein 2